MPEFVVSVREEELAFPLMVDRLCLAFCATVGERWRRGFERLRTPADLARWVVAVGLTSDQVVATGEDLAQARALREAVYRLVRAAMADRAGVAADRDLVNEWAREPDLAPQLDAGGTRSVWGAVDPLRACLSTVARDAIGLLTGPEVQRVRQCAAPDCALLFVDRSRPGKRRWCSDGACGTKNRSARYRQRRGPG